METKPPNKHLLRHGAMAMAAASTLLLASCADPDGFTMADTDESGTVSPSEFERYMLEAIFAEADSDGNSQITFEEWKVANPNAVESKFKAPDRNRDSVVTPPEVKAHFARQGTMDDLFNQIDTDNDGSLTKGEVAAFKEKLAALSGTPLQKLSKSVSTDK
jgi:Ca2+-binding EF-hand superfamily protein